MFGHEWTISKVKNVVAAIRHICSSLMRKG